MGLTNTEKSMTTEEQAVGARAGDGKTRAQAMADAAHQAVQAFVDLVANNEDYEIGEYRRMSKQHSEAVVFAINNLRDLAAAPAVSAPAEQVRRAALEEAANALEPLKARWLPNVRDIYVVGECAATIRALIPKPRAHPKQIAGVGCALCGTNEAGHYCTGGCEEHQDAAENQAPATAPQGGA